MIDRDKDKWKKRRSHIEQRGSSMISLMRKLKTGPSSIFALFSVFSSSSSHSHAHSHHCQQQDSSNMMLMTTFSSFLQSSISLCVLLLFMLCPMSTMAMTRNFNDRNILPRLKDTDVIELYHLRSFPSNLIETSVGTFSTQTSGLALRSITTNTIIVLQYRPKSFANCFLPKIRYNHNGSYVLEWNKEAEIVYHDEIDTNTWQQSTFLARTNGIVYKNYIFWLETFLENNKVYSPQSICSNEYEYPCFTYSKTWDTFLAESIEVFAALSVRINAIIPPRATELRFLSVDEPVEVNIHHHHGRHKGIVDNPEDFGNNTDSTNNSNNNNSSANNSTFWLPPSSSTSTSTSPSSDNKNTTKSVDHPGEDETESDDIADDDGYLVDVAANQSQASSTSTTSPGRTAEKHHLHIRRRTRAAQFSYHRLSTSVHAGQHSTIPKKHGIRREQGQDNNNNNVPPADSPHNYIASNEELVKYYNEIMSCMQEFQLSDFTTALKSCSSENVAFVHIDANRYYKITPRYPYIYVNDYLQNLPDPHFLDGRGVDFVDWGVVVTVVILLVGGVLAVLLKMQLLPFINTQDSEAVGCGGCCPSYSFSVGKGGSRRNQHGASPSRMERLKAKASAFSRLWGAMGWYRYPLYNRNQKTTNRSSGEYFFTAIDTDGNNGDDFSFDLNGEEHNTTSHSL